MRVHPSYIGSFLVIAFALPVAVIIGLFSVFVSPRATPILVLLVVILTILLLLGYTVIAATRGKVWAIGLYMAITIFIIDASFRQRELTAATIDLQTFLKLMIWGGGLIIGLAHLKGSFQMWKSPLGMLLLYAILALLSTTYSIIPAYTFGAAFAFVSFIFLSIAVASRLTEKQIIYFGLLGFGISLVAAVIMRYISPHQGMALMEGGSILRLAGLSGSPNNLGRMASLFVLLLLLLPLLGYWKWRDFRLVPLLVLAVYVLYETQSRTSILAASLAIMYVIFRSYPKVALASFIAFVSVSLINVVGDFIGINQIAYSISRSGHASEVFTFTGRTSIWEFAWLKFLDQPWFGYGYGSTRLLFPEAYRTFWGWTTTSAHNMILQSMVTLGVMGTFFLITALIRQAFQLVHARPFHDSIFIYVILSGLFEPGVVGPAPNVLTILWLISIAMVARDAGHIVPVTHNDPKLSLNISFKR